MDRNKNSYIFIYSIILVVVVAGALSLVAVLLQPKQAKNYEIEQKRNILSALKINVETKDVESTYAKIVTEIAVDDSGNEVEKEDALQEQLGVPVITLKAGPAGVFDYDDFCDGSRAIGNAIAEATAEGAFSLIGGGDSVACVNKFGLADKVSYISTGGGALLEAIEGKVLPGVAAVQG